MTNRTNDISLRRAAVVAGMGLLIMSIIAPFSEFFVRQSLIVPGDAATTATNIMANELLLEFGVFSVRSRSLFF